MLAILNEMQTKRVLTPTAKYTCKFCHTLFVLEARFLAHKCKQMKRDEEFRSPNGQTAWHYYTLWLRQQKRLPPRDGESFKASKYFRTFMNFVEFSKKVNLPKPDKFIWLMVQKDFSPIMWTCDEVYAIYLEFLDRKTSPLEQANLSIQTLFKYAEKNEVDVSDVFTKMQPHDLIHLLMARQLSPWLLLCCKKLKPYLLEKTTPEQRLILNNIIRPDYWAEKMEEHPDDVEKIRMLTKEMGI